MLHHYSGRCDFTRNLYLSLECAALLRDLDQFSIARARAQETAAAQRQSVVLELVETTKLPLPALQIGCRALGIGAGRSSPR